MACLFQDSVAHVKGMAKDSPRIIKTHFPPSHLPPKVLETAKIVWVCRNPKDSITSWWGIDRRHLRVGLSWLNFVA